MKVEGPHPEVGLLSISGTNTNRVGPTVYVFSTDKTRNTRMQEITMKIDSAFDLELHLLDGLTWDDNNGQSSDELTMSEVKEGLGLDSI